jgi:hypothetical protein
MRTIAKSCIGMLMAGAAMLPHAPLAAGHPEGPRVLDPSAKAFGKTFHEWAAAWSNWVYQFPADQFPIQDQSGASCRLGQHGKVWFLAGSGFNAGPIVRHCTIPAGKALFFPIAQGLSFKPEFPFADDKPQCLALLEEVEQVRCDVNSDLSVLVPRKGATVLPVLEVKVDGVPIADPFSYRVQSPPGGFTFVISEKSLLVGAGFPAGPRSPAVADGYWIMLDDLAPGSHTVRIFAKDIDGSVEDVTWNLTVQH